MKQITTPVSKFQTLFSNVIDAGSVWLSSLDFDNIGGKVINSHANVYAAYSNPGHDAERLDHCYIRGWSHDRWQQIYTQTRSIVFEYRFVLASSGHEPEPSEMDQMCYHYTPRPAPEGRSALTSFIRQSEAAHNGTC